MDQKIIESLGSLKASLRDSGIREKEIIVFGSQARGSAAKHSDIDVVIISDDFKGMNLRERLETIGLALAKARIMEPIEALGYTGEEYDLKGRGTFIGDEVKAKGAKV